MENIFKNVDFYVLGEEGYVVYKSKDANEINCIEWTGKNVVEVYNFLEDKKVETQHEVSTEGKNFYIKFDNGTCNLGSLILKTLQGDIKINIGDVIIKKPDGTFTNRKHNINFGEAIDACKEGLYVSRKGWNGKNQFIFLIKGKDLQNVLKYGYGEYVNEPTIVDVLAIKTSSNQIQIGWLATQTDMLSNDWYIL